MPELYDSITVSSASKTNLKNQYHYDDSHTILINFLKNYIFFHNNHGSAAGKSILVSIKKIPGK